MELKLYLGIFALLLPVIAAIGLVYYMSTGKGKPAPTQTELEEAKKRKSAENKD